MRRSPLPPILLPALLWLACAAPPVQALPPDYTLQLVHTGLDFPTTIRFAPDGRMFYTELLTGRIMVLANELSSTPTVWGTVPVATGGEHGLLGMTFHPDFPDSPFVYVFHSRPSPVYNRIARLREVNGVGTDYTVLLDSLFANALGRFGGRMAFGPDRQLYVTIGDCTLPSAAQDTSVTIGKLLRLGFTGKPSADNPFGPKNPVCAIGVRNPYGLCFDPQTGYGYFTDNGPLCDDELNRLVVGVNYGWGNDDTCGDQPPGTYPSMYHWTPTIGVTGCTMYRGTTYPDYNGNLFMGSYTDATIRRVAHHPYAAASVVDSVEIWVSLPTPDTHILDVTQGPDGRIWFCTYDQVWRVLEPPTGGPVAVPVAAPAADLSVAPNPSAGAVSFRLAGAAALDELEIIDAAGRRVRRWAGPIAGGVVWDGATADGRPAGAGVYWVRARIAGGTLTRRVVRVAR